MARTCEASKSVFATVPYEPDENGVLRAVLPERCPLATGAEGEACSLYVDHRRKRKTGPRMALVVAGCRVHRQRRFTLYPPGYVPYSREPVATCSVTGEPLLDSETAKPVWEETLFGAAADAAAGVRWPSESRWNDPRRRRTQGRRLQKAARVLGVHPAVKDGERERIGTRLGVPTLLLRTAARDWARNWALRGAVVLTVLMTVPVDGAFPDRLLEAGAVTAQWAVPRRWDVMQRTWLPIRSGEPEFDEVDSRLSRGPPPTNLHAAHGRESV